MSKLLDPNNFLQYQRSNLQYQHYVLTGQLPFSIRLGALLASFVKCELRRGRS